MLDARPQALRMASLSWRLSHQAYEGEAMEPMVCLLLRIKKDAAGGNLGSTGTEGDSRVYDDPCTGSHSTVR